MEIRAIQSELNVYRRKAVSEGQKAYMRRDRLVVNGEPWTLQELRENFEVAPVVRDSPGDSGSHPGASGRPAEVTRKEERTLGREGAGTRKKKREESGSSPENGWRHNKKPVTPWKRKKERSTSP
ncbi:unnamed protein product [Nesidiocoris tenuis]|uniref:Uncharacterized protein n=1 Tax=Nesidiocoris tenuis TaxID=355587 RepID=A0A6H5H6D9_9HEMI|nr:unnamed protein product [Nesidiocoris tenuis]